MLRKVSFMITSGFLVFVLFPGISAGKTLLIGTSLPYSGVMARYGKMAQRGYEFYKDYVNEKGGIEVGGEKYKIALKYYDDKSDAATGAKMAEKLIIDENIKFLIGPVGSGPGFAATSVAEKFKLPMVLPLSGSDKVYTRGYKYIFGILNLSSTDQISMFGFLMGLNPKPKKIAIMSRNDLFPLTSAKGARDKAKKLGIEVVMFETYPAGIQDMSSMLHKAKFLKPDVLYATGHIGEAIQVAKQLKEMGLYFPVVMMTAGPESAEFADSLKDGAEGIMGLAKWVSSLPFKGPVFGTASDYSNRFKKKYQYMPSYVEAACSNALVIYQLGIQKANSLDPQKVRDAISSLDTSTFYGKVRFDERGANVGAQNFPFQIQKGSIVPVYPPEFATGKVVFPHPKYKR